MGASFQIAGRNEADATSMLHAIYLAIDVFRHRQEYDEALENPLPKLYKEKRDESDKVRYAIPKKREDRIPRHDDDSTAGNKDKGKE